MKPAKNMIEFHADDYGMFPAQSARIRKCIEEGVLNGISIMPNSPHLKECMEALTPLRDSVRIAVHLNFVHGYPLSGSDAVPHLVRRDGAFHIPYQKALLASYYPGMRRVYKEEFKKEIRAQLKACDPFMKPEDYRIDTHLHYLMVPVIFDALMEVIREDNRVVSYIRVPAEDFKAYSRCGGLKHIPPVNIVKAVLLKTLAVRNRIRYGSYLKGRTHDRFYGVLYSGHMTMENVRPLLDDYRDHYAAEEAEFLFHPGAVYEEEDIRQLTAASDKAFLTDALRDKEAEALCLLKQG